MSYDGLWIEDYRATKLDQIIGQEKIVNACRNYIKNGQYPHLIFSGPAGVGKTTIAYILAFGVSGVGNTLILNASDENSIEIVRTVIKDFARTEGQHQDIFKTIILDEGDNISSKAQQALRKIMEDYAKYCRFIITCNYSHKIIDPIKSRCIEFIFNKIPAGKMMKRLWEICKENELEMTLKQLQYIVMLFSGDMRKCINILNALKMGATFDMLVRVADPVKYLKLISSGDIKLLREYIDKSIYNENDLKFLISRCIDIIAKNIDNGKLIDMGIKDPRKLLLILVEADYKIASGAQYYSIMFGTLLYYHNN